MARSEYVSNGKGGFGLRNFKEYDLPDDGLRLLSSFDASTGIMSESIPTILVERIVDIMVRFVAFNNNDAFSRVVAGASILDGMTGPERRAYGFDARNASREAMFLINNVSTQFNQPNIRNVARLAWISLFDGETEPPSFGYERAAVINGGTHRDIEVMVMRTLYGMETFCSGISDYGLRLEAVETMHGFADFLTGDGTLLDLDVSDHPMTRENATKIISYYIMGKIENAFTSIEQLGVINPRLNKIWLCDVSRVNDALVESIMQHM